MKTRYAATASLGVMAAGFAVTTALADGGGRAVELLQGGFEAGLVGGIADWFAVSALFRHPLGLKIPHTNLLLKNKPKLINALVSSLENELLNKESISARLRKLNLIQSAGRQAVRMLAKRKNREAVLTALQGVVQRLPVEKLSSSLLHGAAGYARGAELQPLAERAAGAVIREGWDEKALDYALDQAIDWISKPSTGKMLGELAQAKLQELQVGGFMGFAVQAFAGFMNEDKMGAMLQHMLLSGVKDLTTPGSRQRDALLLELRSRLIGLAEDGESLGKAKEWAALKLESAEAAEFVSAKAEELRGKLLDWLEEDKRRGGRLVLTAMKAVRDRLSSEPELVRGWEERLSSLLVQAIEGNHYRIGLLVRDNLNKLDDKQLVDMLESKVGSDLQWIRVNGAVCGFLIGLVLTMIGWI
ncbi:DUF445 domain-containing protein [Paenibacillus albicereus]|uniref:DUF445 domain-containing protein n=1 Tax=Paenibacillus albicereus TaxID=2726185 RepID=A0A6H2GVC0_9BACL|nr:DUF445 domain-containing protein [Paenibacillus albicereus]QJC51373.1 DUF445 domain-containing protein [Paenibacillus albicereus]